MRGISLVILLAVLVAPFPSRAEAAQYDVAYLWHASLDEIHAYGRKVARLLGPRLARQLRVAEAERGFGLIYDRDGDRTSSVDVARAHSRVLRRHGLPAAEAVLSREWKILPSPFAAEVLAGRPAVTRPPVALPAPASPLERRIEAFIKDLRRRGELAPDERTAWSVFDFTTGEKLVTINEDRPMQAASMVKPLFALAFFHRVSQKRLSYDARSRRQMEAMIQHSSNSAANWVLRRVGGPAAAQRILRRHYGEIFRRTRIVEYIPRGGRTYRNKASAHDYSRFLYAVWKGRVPYARELKRLLGLPSGNRIVTSGLDRPAALYNKTGSTSMLCGDMGVLEVEGPDGRRHAYTVIGIIEKTRRAKPYGRWIRSRGNVIRDVAALVHRALAARHRPVGPSAAVAR